MRSINTAYDINDEVWFMHKNKATSGKIIKINISVTSEEEIVTYKIKFGFATIVNRKDLDLFKTKEDLLKSL